MLMFKVEWLETYLSCAPNSCRFRPLSSFVSFRFYFDYSYCVCHSLWCVELIQSFFAGLAASGILTSGLRLVTKAVFDKTENGLRKGVSKSLLLTLYTTYFPNSLGIFLLMRLSF